MSAFVLDASMAMAWHFADEKTMRTLAVEDRSDSDTIVVPRHWYAEVANAVWVGERRNRTELKDAAHFFERLAKLVIVVDEAPVERVWNHILPLARAHGLTVYDTFYLELAERYGLPLASLDAALNKAAKRVGIDLVEETT